jgi:hypothetical protein
MLDFFISNPHFAIVIFTAFICLMISFALCIKKGNHLLLRYVLFFCLSILTSLQSTLNTSIYLSNFIFVLFFSYDFLFLLSFTENIFTNNIKYYKSKYFIFIILTILIYLLYYKNTKAIHFVSAFYSLLTLFLTIPFLKKYSKDNNNKIKIEEYQFWIISGFLINSIATLTCTIMIINSNKINSPNTVYLLLFLTMYLSWVIKYLMLIKSNLCLMKQIKYGA